MHTACFNFLCCLHLAKPGLPSELRERIFLLSNEVRKEWRQKEQRSPFSGISKSAAKRRANRLERCMDCGNLTHIGKCRKSTTLSQDEFKMFIMQGSIRYSTERPLRKNSFVKHRVKEELKMIEHFKS